MRLFSSLLGATVVASSLSLRLAHANPAQSSPSGSGSTSEGPTATGIGSTLESTRGSSGGSQNGRFTFYNGGGALGACGKPVNDGDFTVALNQAQFGSGYPGPHCFQEITITYNGKSHDATITDMCPGCPEGGLDLTPTLFEFFASQDVGVINGQWSFKDGNSGSSGNGNGSGGNDGSTTESGSGAASSTTPASSGSGPTSTGTEASTSEHHRCCKSHSEWGQDAVSNNDRY